MYPKSSKMMMSSAILNMAPHKARPFKPKQVGRYFEQWFGQAGLQADTLEDLRAAYDALIARSRAYPMPIWG